MAGIFDAINDAANQVGQGATGGTGTPGGLDPAIAALLSGPVSGAEVASDENPPVWMGQTDTEGTYSAGEFTKTGTEYIPTNYSKVLNLPYTWDTKRRREVMERMNSAGLEVYSFGDLLSVWGSVAEMAAQSWAATDGANPMTPWDIIDSQKRDAQHFGLLDGSGNPIDGSGPDEPEWEGEIDEDGNWVTRRKTKSVDEVDDGDAWSLMQQAAQAALGREATHNEVRRFAYKANKIASESPEVTSTKTTIDPETGQVIETDTNSRGGFSSGDAQKLAQEQADTPEAGAYQAASTYFNAFTQALDSVV